MKTIKIIGLCLVTVFTMGAATTMASADSIVKETGAGELVLTDGTSLKWSKDFEIIAQKSAAELTTEANVFTGVERGGVKCNSAGAKEGEVKTAALTETFGFINKAKSEVGLEVKPTSAEGPLAKFSCGETTVEVRGAVIGSITPVNKLVTPKEHFTTEFAQKEGKQAIKKFEGGSEVGLEIRINGGSFERVGFKDPGELIAEEESEIVTSPTLEFR